MEDDTGFQVSGQLAVAERRPALTGRADVPQSLPPGYTHQELIGLDDSLSRASGAGSGMRGA